MRLKTFIAEARSADKKYTEEKTKGLLTKVILELEGSEAGAATRLAKRYSRLKTSIKRLEEAEAELQGRFRGMVDDSFDSATDELVTRVITTTQFTISLAKKQEKKPMSEVDYGKVFEGLEKLISEDLQLKVLELIKANTRTWDKEPPKAGLSVKPVKEGVLDAAKGALVTMMTAFKEYAAKLKTSFKSWGKQYDAKLENLKDLAKGIEEKPVVAEAKAVGKFTSFITEGEDLEVLRKKLKWHTSRAGSGGNYNTADRLATQIQAIEDKLDTAAKGTNETTLDGKKYVRKDVKASWQLCESTEGLSDAEKDEIIADFRAGRADLIQVNAQEN